MIKQFKNKKIFSIDILKIIMSEYTNPTVNNLGCSYSNLVSTYGGTTSVGQVPSMSNYIVPKLCYSSKQTDQPTYPPPYNTLTGSGQTCGGHFNMQNAYPFANCTNCSAQYITRPCNGTIESVCNQPQPPASSSMNLWY
jgi:hypothetical protein